MRKLRREEIRDDDTAVACNEGVDLFEGLRGVDGNNRAWFRHVSLLVEVQTDAFGKGQRRRVGDLYILRDRLTLYAG